MAAGTKIIMRFGTAAGEKNFIYNHANAEANAASVKNAMEAMINNGTIFRFPPLTMISAKSQVTTEHEFDLS